MASFDNNDGELTAFVDVDFLEADKCGTTENIDDLNGPADIQSDEHFVPVTDSIEPATSCICENELSSIAFAIADTQVDQREVTLGDTEMESCYSSDRVVENVDRIVDDQSSLAGGHTSLSSEHSIRLSSEIVPDLVDMTFPLTEAADGGELEASLTAVLMLDSDGDSPRRQKTCCESDNSDGVEVDVAKLQWQLAHLTTERDNYKTLYCRCKEENDNFQEQILEVCDLIKFDLFFVLL